MRTAAAWFGHRIDSRVHVHVRREFVRVADGGQPPLAPLSRNVVALRLLLWGVFMQAVGDDNPTTAVHLVDLAGLGHFPSRKTQDAADRAEVQRVARARRTLNELGLVEWHRQGSIRPGELYGCGVRIQLGDSQHSAVMQPGHGWKSRRDLLIPAGFWTRGWVAHLGAPEIIGLLGLFDRGADHRDATMRGRPVRALYGISGETWRRSAVALARAGLVEEQAAADTKQSYRYRIISSRMQDDAPSFC